MRIIFLGLCLLLVSMRADAQLNLAQKPIYSGGNIPPLVMLDLSKDHQLYFKAYNDYSDLDGNGTLETTYTNSIDYYGYFDSYKCYDYNKSTNRFEPASVTENKYCSSKWSGNFLNWVSMSRMDAVRKLLYGGLRSTDTGNVNVTTQGTTTTTLGVTVLERSFQPTDAHAWAKFYNGNDLLQLAPIDSVGTGLTFCNVTPGSTEGDNQYSQGNTKAPLIRVVKGDYALWASNESWQCTWKSEHAASNGNVPAKSDLNSATDSPDQSKGFGNGSAQGEYVARVQVCVPGLLGKENCEQYPDLTYKPVGLLQAYGERGQMKFGLMTGSHTKNISGGVLRRNITDFSSEINIDTNGTFKFGLVNAPHGDIKGIVHNLNKMRIYGYDYKSGGYTGTGIISESCNFQMTGLVMSGGGTGQGDAANEGNCSSWGNPISEIFLESIRYFAGLRPTPAFTYQTDEATKDSKLGLTIESWVDPLPLEANGRANNYCSPLNTLIFNPAVSSYDNDQMDMTGIGSANGQTAANETNTVGAGESVSEGSTWLIGSNSVNAVSSDGTCTAKTLDGLSNASGICPEAPTQKGTYLMAGAAYYAKTNRIREMAGVPLSDKESLKVTTYGIQLATNTPSITVNVKGNLVKIIPAYRVNAGGKGVYASGTLVDFKVVKQTATTGKFYINWEDSNQGGDFDKDVWGILRYTISNGQITVYTQAISAVSQNAQGFGYVISGTNKDGAHFHSGAYNFNYTDATGVTGCNNCNALTQSSGTQGGVETGFTYTATGTSAGQLQDPLWYAAKWGGFSGTEPGDKPDAASKWDLRRADGAAIPDGVPDNYFFVANPGALKASLERAFISILSTSSSSSVATNSGSLETDSMVYQARFDPKEWSGELLAYRIDLDGKLGLDPVWDAGNESLMPAPDSRVILTYDNDAASTQAGIPFRWGDSFPYKPQLAASDDNDLANALKTKAQKRLDWIRGVRSDEGPNVTQLRQRFSTVLGDIVNSNPQFVGAPVGGYDDGDYFDFAAEHEDREAMLYVGANDGMLHGFSAVDGKEKLAYIPSSVIPNLKDLTGQSYLDQHRYYVDGTPTIADVKVGARTWKTLLVGGLGAGGKGMYALDVTDVNAFSEGHANSIVQWEFTNLNDENLGYTFSQPSIVQMANGRWAAIFGNGYNSTTQKAALFIVFLDRAADKKTWDEDTDYIRLDINIANNGVVVPNGMSTPTAIDIDVDGVTDYIYAGDLLGNMWKFNVTSTNPAEWKLAYGTEAAPKSLYTAKTAAGAVQPITSAPEIIRNTSADGFVVVFGTGQYLQTADTDNTTLQTLYGIWDEDTATTPTINRSNLVAQSIQREFTSNNIVFRLTSDNPVVYGNEAGNKRGWYMDLRLQSSALQGERVIYTPTVRNGRLIATTIIPSENICTSGGSSWLMELDALTGGALDTSPLDVNGDNAINNSDMQPSGEGDADSTAPGGRKNEEMGLTPPPTVIDGPNGPNGPGNEYKIISGSSGKTETVLESKSSSSGRLSWREIMQ